MPPYPLGGIGYQGGATIAIRRASSAALTSSKPPPGRLDHSGRLIPSRWGKLAGGPNQLERPAHLVQMEAVVAGQHAEHQLITFLAALGVQRDPPPLLG